jgi:uncharacterized membrane protein
MNFDLLSLSVAVAVACGLRTYAVAAIIGALAYFKVLALPDSLAVLTQPWLILTASFFAIVEMMADKTPGVDSVWDTIHTFVRIPAGAMLGGGLGAEALGGGHFAAMATLGGTLAASTHAMKAGVRAVLNLSPEPVTNWLASLTEGAFVVALLAFALLVPALALILSAMAVMMAMYLLPKIMRGLRLIYRKLFAGGQAAEAA